MDNKQEDKFNRKENVFLKYKKVVQVQPKQFQNLKTKTVFRNRNLGGHK